MKQTDTNTLIKALRILANDIHCEDGVATSVIREAADRIETLDKLATDTVRASRLESNFPVPCLLMHEESSHNLREALNRLGDQLREWESGEAKDRNGSVDYGSNAGIRCDSDDGPCACGAWH